MRLNLVCEVEEFEVVLLTLTRTNYVNVPKNSICLCDKIILTRLHLTYYRFW